MNRRTFVTGVIVGLLLPPVILAMEPAPGGAPRVVMLRTADEAEARPYKKSFLEGMREAGQIEGRTFQLDLRYAEREPGRSLTLIRQSVSERPAVLVVAGLIMARHARDTTSTIPVVVATSSDLVDAGIVKSFAHPGGNITGVSDLTDETTVKRLELLKVALPSASRVAFFVNPDFPATPKIVLRAGSAAASLGISLVRFDATNRTELSHAIDSLTKTRPDALLVAGDALTVANADELIDRVSAMRIPIVYFWPGAAERGALMSYHVDIQDNYRRAARYVDQILKGARAGDLPIHQPTRYELVVNTKVARSLGITVPQSVLLRADRIIE